MKIPYDLQERTLMDIFPKSFILELDISKDLYTKDPIKVVEGKENRGNRGTRMKAQYVHCVFAMFFDTVIRQLIETNELYRVPINLNTAYIYFCKKKEVDIDKLFLKKKGMFASVDPIETDFKAYNLYFSLKNKSTGINDMYPIRIDYQSYQYLVHKTQNGMRYWDSKIYPNQILNQVTTRQLSEEFLLLFPDLKYNTFLKIVRKGFSEIIHIKRAKLAVKIRNFPRGINIIL